VRMLLEINDSQISNHLNWDMALLQPSGGLVLTDLEITPIEGLKIKTPLARVRFSWTNLLLLRTRIEGIDSKEIVLDWTLPKTSPEINLDYAAPTEAHIAEAKKALDALQKVIATNGISIKSSRWILAINNDTLTLHDPALHATLNDSCWTIQLNSGNAIRKPWPLPSTLQTTLVLSDTSIHMTSLDACWNGGCLVGEGTLGMGEKHSKLSLEMKDIPLEPFGELALPKKAHWKGKARGKFNWQGRIAHPDSWRVEGSVSMHNVEFLHWPFQRESTFSNFVPELSEKLSIAKIDVPEFKLQAGKVTIDSLHVDAGDLEAVAKGTWTFPERLDFRLTGSIHRDLYEKLPHLTRLALPKTNDGGGSFKATLSGTFAWQAIIPDPEHYGTALRNLFK